jgi:hypothetical protein
VLAQERSSPGAIRTVPSVFVSTTNQASETQAWQGRAYRSPGAGLESLAANPTTCCCLRMDQAAKARRKLSGGMALSHGLVLEGSIPQASDGSLAILSATSTPNSSEISRVRCCQASLALRRSIPQEAPSWASR